jgi:ribosomal protein S18 acetylase RimI-like enzyme
VKSRVDVWPAAELRPFSAAEDEWLIGWFEDAAALRRFGGPALRWPLDRPQLEAIRRDPGLAAFTLWADRPVGHVELRRLGSRHARLARVGVDPAQRGRGLGRVLLARTLAEARRRGFETFELGVYPDNTPAVRLYESFGFRVGGPPGPEGFVTMTRA